MPKTYWLGTTSGNWGTATNWSLGAVPVTGDEVTIDARSSVGITLGLNQSAVTLARLTIVKGCPPIGTTAAPLQVSATVLDINLPPADGSNPQGAVTINLDTGSNQTTAVVYGSANTGAGGLEPVVWKGAHASNVLRVYGGAVGVATCLPADTATLPTMEVLGGNDCRFRVAPGVTLTTLTQTGGVGVLGCPATTVNQDGGEIETRGTGAIGTLRVSGVARLNSTGTITTLDVETGGVADFEGNTAARTISAATVSGTGRVKAALPTNDGATPALAFTAGVKCIKGARSGQVDFGGSVTVVATAA